MYVHLIEYTMAVRDRVKNGIKSMRITLDGYPEVKHEKSHKQLSTFD